MCYASSWLKCHEPAIFTCALVNSWPMGFYSPDQLLQEARRQGIEVRPVDVCHSDWDCTLEPEPGEVLAIRMGLRLVRGLAEADARRLEQARARRPWRDVEDLCLRAGLDSRARAQLADAGALRALASDRHQARWQVAAVQPQLPLFADIEALPERTVELPVPSVAEDLMADYQTLGTTLGPHPLTLLRSRLRALGCRSSRELQDVGHGDNIAVAGLVVGRQRPQTASGVTFVTLEDEHGMGQCGGVAGACRTAAAGTGGGAVAQGQRAAGAGEWRAPPDSTAVGGCEPAVARAGCTQPGLSLKPHLCAGTCGSGQAREAAPAVDGTGFAGVRGHARSRQKTDFVVSRYTIANRCLRVGAGNARSIARRSSPVRVSAPAAAFNRTCSGVTALGMAITPSLRVTHARLTWATVAPWRSAISASTGLLEQAPGLGQRAVGHGRQRTLFAPRQQVELDATLGRVVQHLVGGAIGVVQFAQVVDIEIGKHPERLILPCSRKRSNASTVSPVGAGRASAA
ncbi:error-prone DNA polymerase, partial [Pseudomonas putida S11]